MHAIVPYGFSARTSSLFPLTPRREIVRGKNGRSQLRCRNTSFNKRLRQQAQYANPGSLAVADCGRRQDGKCFPRPPQFLRLVQPQDLRLERMSRPGLLLSAVITMLDTGASHEARRRRVNACNFRGLSLKDNLEVLLRGLHRQVTRKAEGMFHTGDPGLAKAPTALPKTM